MTHRMISDHAFDLENGIIGANEFYFGVAMMWNYGCVVMPGEEGAEGG